VDKFISGIMPTLILVLALSRWMVTVKLWQPWGWGQRWSSKRWFVHRSTTRPGW